MLSKFAAFILTHGRAENVCTYSALRKCGYTGRIFLLVDDKDKQVGEYQRLYGDEVIVFSKDEAVAMTDSCDNYKKHNSVLYARNYNFIVAQKLGLDYFWQLDDDYAAFRWAFNNENEYVCRNVSGLDRILEACVTFLETSGAMSVAFAQGGDFIGGVKSGVAQTWLRKNWFSRKVMNTFLFKTSRPVQFLGRCNDDVNTYLERGRRGLLFVTIPRLRVEQKQTQQNDGGLTDMYRDLGTYIKSFYSVIVSPSCVSISTMGVVHRRFHHFIRWPRACPAIVSEKYRKERPAESKGV